MFHIHNTFNVVIDKSRDDLAFVYSNDGNVINKLATARSWSRDSNATPINVTNEFICGYEIVGFASRYSTDNKWIRIRSPKKFIFEISIEYFVDMVPLVKIDSGIIYTPLQLIFTKGSLDLVVEGSSKHIQYQKDDDESKKREKAELEIGCVYQDSRLYTSTKLVYIGKLKVNVDPNVYYHKSRCLRYPSLEEYVYKLEGDFSYTLTSHIFVRLNDVGTPSSELIPTKSYLKSLKLTQDTIFSEDEISKLRSKTYKSIRDNLPSNITTKIIEKMILDDSQSVYYDDQYCVKDNLITIKG